MKNELRLTFEVQEGKTTFCIVSTDPITEYPYDNEETDKLLYSSDYEDAFTQNEVEANFKDALSFFELYKKGNES